MAGLQGGRPQGLGVPDDSVFVEAGTPVPTHGTGQVARCTEMSSAERRTGRRWTVGDGVKVEIVGRGRTLTLTNVGAGGFSVASEQHLATITRPEFRFSVPAKNWSTVLSAQMAYCLMQPRRNGALQGQYVTGFTFCDSADPDVQRRIQEFLDAVTPAEP